MKLLKRHYDHLLYIHLPIIAISLTLIFFCKNQIILTLNAHWVILLFALIPLFLPLGNKRLGKDNQTPKIKWPIWLGLIFALELSLYVFFYVFCYVLRSTDTSLNISTLYFLNQAWGIYPWGIYILVALMLSFISFREGKSGMTSVALQPLFKNTTEDAIGITSDNYTRISIIYSLCSALSFVSLAFVITFAKIYHFTFEPGAKISTMLLMSMLLWVTFIPETQKFLHKILRYHLPPVLVIIPFVIFLSFIIVLFTVLFQVASVYLPLLNLQTPLFSPETKKAYFIIFAGMWWIIWTPLISGAIAYLSEGYRIRSVILGVMVIPLLINIVPITKPNPFFNRPEVGIVLTTLSLVIIFVFFFRKKYLTYFMRAVLPGTQKIKIRSPIHYLRKLMQNIILFVIAYLTAGVSLMSIVFFLAGLPAGLVMIYICVAFYKHILSKKNPPEGGF